MKTLNVTVICKAIYNSSIEVPDDMTLEEAIEYAKQHTDEIPTDEMEWISDIEIDDENCDFDKDYDDVKEDGISRPVNVYGSTSYYENGSLECVYDGFGYRDRNGNITWYDGYTPKDDEFHLTTIAPYGNGKDLSELIK